MSTEADAAKLALPAAARQRSPAWFAWRRFLANKAAVAGGIILSILILAAIFAPLFTKTDPAAQAYLTQALAFPSAEFWFGIDDLGRDFFTRIVYGARVSLTIGFAAASFSVLIGIPLGALAGYFGGRTDWVIMRVIELFSVVPSLLAALLLGALTGGGFLTIIVISALFGPIKYGILPDHLERRELPAANAWIEGGTFIAILTGTIAAAVSFSDVPPARSSSARASTSGEYPLPRRDEGRRPEARSVAYRPFSAPASTRVRRIVPMWAITWFWTLRE